LSLARSEQLFPAKEEKIADETKAQEGLGVQKEAILASQKEAVRRFGAAEILAKRKIIGERIRFGMDEIVSNTESLAEIMDVPIEQMTLEIGLGLPGIARLSLAELALPPRFEQLEDQFLPALWPHLDDETRAAWDEIGGKGRAAVYLDLKNKHQLKGPSVQEISAVLVANEQDWWEELDDEQKRAFYQFFKEEFGLDVESQKQPANQWLEEQAGVILDELEGWEIIVGTKEIYVPETSQGAPNRFQLAFVFVPDHEDPHLVPYFQGH